jgi:small subunit ribosomal protein S16
LAVRIRLTRVGATKRPAYRVIAIDQRRSRDGRALEILGYYDPLTEPATVQLQSDRISAWIGKGAQPSDTVVRLMRQAEREAAGPPSDTPKRPARSKGITAATASSAKAAKPKAPRAKAAAAPDGGDEGAPTAAAEESAEGNAEAAAPESAESAESTETSPSTDTTDTMTDAAADSAVEPAVVEDVSAADDSPVPGPDGETGEPKE